MRRTNKNEQLSTQIHKLPPVWDANSRILILGSFPSVKSRAAGFFYAHPQNRFWRVLANVLQEEVPESVEQKKEMLLRKGVAVWDVIGSCEIIGSDDSSIRNVSVNDVRMLLENSLITSIYANGNKAKQLYDQYIYKKLTELPAELLPSTSPANATYCLERLKTIWTQKLSKALQINEVSCKIK